MASTLLETAREKVAAAEARVVVAEQLGIRDPSAERAADMQALRTALNNAADSGDPAALEAAMGDWIEGAKESTPEQVLDAIYNHEG